MSASKYMVVRTVRRDRTVVASGKRWACTAAEPGRKVIVTFTPEGPQFRSLAAWLKDCAEVDAIAGNVMSEIDADLAQGGCR